MKTILLAITLSTLAPTAFGAVSAAAIAQCNQAQVKLLLKLNDASKEFIGRRNQLMTNFSATVEKSAIARCVYTADTDENFGIRLRGVKSKKAAERVMYSPVMSAWYKLKNQTLQPLITSCIQACTPVTGAAAAKINCSSATENFNTIMEASPITDRDCDLRAADPQNPEMP